MHSQSYNRYSYVWNNPTNLTDPSGFIADGLSDGDAGGEGASDAIEAEVRQEDAEAPPSRSADLTQVKISAPRINQVFENWLLEQQLNLIGNRDRLYAIGGRALRAGGAAAIRVAPRVLAAQALDGTGFGMFLGMVGMAYGAWQIGKDVYHAVAAGDNRPEDALSAPSMKSGETKGTPDDPNDPDPGKKEDKAKVLQTGGNTIDKRTANGLNEHFDQNLNRREWGKALEELKKENGLRNDFHGRIMSNGDYVSPQGTVIDNIGGYIK